MLTLFFTYCDSCVDDYAYNIQLFYDIFLLLFVLLLLDVMIDFYYDVIFYRNF